jgi:hypothetical protein
MGARDNQTAARSHAIDHCPKRIGGELLRSLTAELLETITRLGKLVNAFVGPMMPDHARKDANE